MFKTPSKNRRQQVQVKDTFPLLDVPEITECLQSCDFTISEEQLLRPTPQFVQMLFEQILDTFQGESMAENEVKLQLASENAGVNMSAAAFGGPTNDLQVEARRTMAFLKAIHTFMSNCGVEDASIMDILKPEPVRVKRLLSAVVNFARFREGHIGDCDDLTKESEDLNVRVQEKRSHYEDLRVEVLQMEDELRDSQLKIQSLEEKNSKFENELRQMKKVQEQIALEYNEYRQRKEALVKQLDDENFLIMESRKESDKMKPYIVDSPEIFQKSNKDKATAVASFKTAVDEIERRIRALDISIDTFRVLQSDLLKCIQVIKDCGNEQHRLEEVQESLRLVQDEIQKLQEASTDVDQRVTHLQVQIHNAEEKIERTTKQAESKREAGNARVAELNEKLALTRAKQNVLDQEMEASRAYIHSVEQKMNEMRVQFETEVKAMHIETENLKAHISMYLNDMEPRMT